MQTYYSQPVSVIQQCKNGTAAD